MARISYMQRRRSGMYEFRKRLPIELAGQSAPAHVKAAYPELVNPKTGRFKSELVRSLGTNDEKAAIRADLRHANEVQGQLDAAVAAMKAANVPMLHPPAAVLRRTWSLGEGDLAAIEAETAAELLARDEEERTEGDDRRRLQSREERAQWPDLVPIAEPWQKGMAEDHAHVYGIEVEELSHEFREAYARRDPAIVRAETREALHRHQIPVDPTSDSFHQAGMAVLRGTVRAYDAMLRRQKGDIVDTPAPPIVSSPSPPPPSNTSKSGPKLSEAFARWQEGDGAAGARKPGRSGVLEAKPAVRWFIELHGDIGLGEITKAKAREYRDALARVPKRLPKNLRGLTLRQLPARNLEGYERRGATTINKSIGMLAAIVSYAQREGLLDCVPGFVNPFEKDVKLRVDKRAEEERERFEPSEIAAIFEAGVFKNGERPAAGAGEAAFWFPLIALLSGMRLGEIAGLRLRDLCQDEDTEGWLFDVNPRGGRSVKTASSIRKVPVHPELLTIGLLSYRQSLVDRGTKPEGSLWPTLRSAEGRSLSAPWSKWFSRLLRKKVGITDRRKVFHSFRHTFKRMARDAGIPKEQHNAMTGHEGEGDVGEGYGRGVSLQPLIDAMATIKAPAVVSGLSWREGPTREGKTQERLEAEPRITHRGSP